MPSRGNVFNGFGGGVGLEIDPSNCDLLNAAMDFRYVLGQQPRNGENSGVQHLGRNDQYDARSIHFVSMAPWRMIAAAVANKEILIPYTYGEERMALTAYIRMICPILGSKGLEDSGLQPFDKLSLSSFAQGLDGAYDPARSMEMSAAVSMGHFVSKDGGHDDAKAAAYDAFRLSVSVLIRAAIREGRDDWYALIEPRSLRYWRRMFNVHLGVISRETYLYLGDREPSIAVLATMSSVISAYKAADIMPLWHLTTGVEDPSMAVFGTDTLERIKPFTLEEVSYICPNQD